MGYELTDEQKAIINTLNTDEKVIKINAYAGAAKTSTLVELIKKIRETDTKSRVLYIVFNKSMVEDAKEKFKGLDVECYTTHSFALRRFTALKDGNVEVMNNLNYSDYLKVKNSNFRYKYSKYKNILDMFSAYCLTFDDLETFCENLRNNKGEKYKLYTTDIKSYEIDFFEKLYNYFLEQGKYLHNMYLKEYSCNCKDLIRGYDYFCADELQDLNPLMLNIVKRIRYKKMYGVGDSNQAIYAWNGAVDALNKIKGITMPLSVSFRFNNEICKVANDILSLKQDFIPNSIKNFHNNTDIEDKNKKTILFRTNATMFEYAVDLIKNTDNAKVTFMDIVNGQKGECFDDTFSEMLYFYDQLLESQENEELKNILKKYRKKFKITRSKKIDGYVNIAKKENSNLYNYLCRNKEVLSLDLTKFFNFFLINEEDIIDILERIRNSENNNNPEKEYYLCTAHASKGRQWSWVKISDDMWKIDTEEEINLLYVACTRAKNKLDYESVRHLIYQEDEES